jgi:hypothetical protein
MPPKTHVNLHELTGGGCRKLPGQCPHTVCRFNLTSELRDNRGAQPAERHLPVVREACALDAAELDGMTLKEIAGRLSLTPERVRQIELGALTKFWLRLSRNIGESPALTVRTRRYPRIAA